MQNVKLIIASIIACVLIGLGLTVYFQSQKIKQINAELSTAVINEKAYSAENSSLKERTIQFQFTVDQLNNSNDSLIQKLNETRKQLKIKDKNIKELQYIASKNQKKDSVIIQHDTLFRDLEFKLDTLLSDEWAHIRLGLEYPGKIVADYGFKNETTIVTSKTKETVDPPKKCWLARLFQKKHTLITVDVIQANPYCTNEKERHIQIID